MTKEEQFVNELIGYIFAYPDDDYMTMECLCRKLHKYGLIEKKDGEWTTDFIERNSNGELLFNDKPTTQTETQNSNLTFEKDECAKEYEELGLKELKELIEAERKTENSSENPNNCEPQTDCGDFADRLAYERGVKHAWEVAQKVFNSTVTFYEAEDVAKQIDKDINVRSKDEPQTERSNE